MNEEDTFRRLRRSTFLEVYRERLIRYTFESVPEDFYDTHGWTREEFMKEMELQVFNSKEQNRSRNPV